MFIHDETDLGRLQNTLEGKTTATETDPLPCGPNHPVGPTGQPLLRMSVLHRLKDQIYAVAQGWFDPRVQD
jgi:hypothetical protein